MTTSEVATKLVGLCREGKNLEAIETLYHDDVVSHEMPGYAPEVTQGIKAVHQKNEEWFANLQQFHGATISDPMVAGNHFTTHMTLDVTFGDGNRMEIEELGVYQVENGKVIRERFFYTMN